MFVNGSTAYKIQPVEMNNDYSAELNSALKQKADVYGTENLQEEQYSVPEKLTAKAVDKANKALLDSGRRLEFKIHEATKQVMVKVVNSGTGEVVREIPSEKILDMVASMCKTAGILVDERR